MLGTVRRAAAAVATPHSAPYASVGHIRRQKRSGADIHSLILAVIAFGILYLLNKAFPTIDSMNVPGNRGENATSSGVSRTGSDKVVNTSTVVSELTDPSRNQNVNAVNTSTIVVEEKVQQSSDTATTTATAVLVIWKRERNLPKIMAYLDTKPWIEEIILWNNGRRALPPLSNKTRVVEPPANLKDYSKYLACAEAKTEYCYYQDDDYNANLYIDNLWDVAMLHPNDITSATGKLTWSHNEYWSVFNEQLGLHAQFSWIGCGAVFPRWLALRHLKIMKDFFTPDEQGLSDVAFAWCTNQVPLQQLQVKLRPIPDPKGFKGFQQELPEKVAKHSFYPMRIKTLKTLPAILAKYPMPHKEIESPCYYVAAHSGLALCTTWRPFPTQSIPFNISDTKDLDKRTGMYIYHHESADHRKHAFLDALQSRRGRRWESGDVPLGGMWGISSPVPRNITIHGIGPDHGWQFSVDGGAANPSSVVWGKEWEIQHNITFQWRGDSPTFINVSKVSIRS